MLRNNLELAYCLDFLSCLEMLYVAMASKKKAKSATAAPLR